ncbi:hypothetical protein LNTAR_21360 [Lentisphaera araneosa HTCC2155]|uniref:Uncharacterized protein n=1 Tax=Lentisphaera araneosa HTCC2155 TaxID=313628 RepID=A6DM06_9BACT|nr:hypothetical protein [Lentisphaera araneosa]EDM27304.1 hypothetical protein LNTAR_21360 [Lentisphaera araneosa HTCC2155]
MKYLLLLIMAISSQVYAQEGAFRCNLDLRARILVFQFSKDFIAYDTHKGSFWKYWQASDKKPGVEFVGAVYNSGGHGPQPISHGEIIVERKTQDVWSLGAKEAQYVSYSPVRKTLTCKILRSDASSIKIIESPEFKQGRFYRNFLISGLKKGEKINLNKFEVSQNGSITLEVK